MNDIIAQRLKAMLRDYQTQAATDVAKAYGKGLRRVVLAMPTGAGKTETAAGIMLRIILAGLLPKGKRCYFVVHLNTLCEQAAERFAGHGFKVAILQGDNTTPVTDDTDIVVASIHTIRARWSAGEYGTNPIIPDDVGMVIIDECHVINQRHVEIMQTHTDMLVVGLSATPLRPGMGNLYEKLITGPSPRECVNRGWLVPWKCFGPSKVDLQGVAVSKGDYAEGELGKRMIELVGDTVTLYQQFGEDRPCIVFAVNILHAERIAEEFNKAGYIAAAVHYKTPAEDWERIRSGFNSGSVRVLVSVVKLAVGFDAPIASCCIMARPTLSEILYYQMCGRPARPHPASGKVDCILIDQTGNIERFGKPIDFDYPETLDPGSLEARAKQKRQETTELRPCLSCGYLVERLTDACPNCGAIVKPQANVIHRHGEIINLDTPDGQQRMDELDGIEERERRRNLYRQVVTWLRRNDKADGTPYNTWYAIRLWEQVYREKPPIHPPSAARDLEPDAATERWIRNAQAQKYAIEKSIAKKRQRGA